MIEDLVSQKQMFDPYVSSSSIRGQRDVEIFWSQEAPFKA